ncbi:dipeptidase 1 precursor [Stemphylium lycopersici]|uniref:Molybdenum cofactor sulfurase n=1 Tax=Stemphylium lycopersici TaxID=183478 RepID=A0A364N3X9_STELY|nr:dipeptidase 1 precursor [Stemphylium lycopersici]RAR11125.1 PLP-dependent transferase [Stemphylium lycopersici]
MAIISANNMIRSISLFHITLAVVLLKNPALIANQGIILVLGQAMHLPTPRDFNKASAATAFLSIVFAFLGVSDLASLSLHEQISDEYWGLQAPVRLLFLFVLTAYSYTFKEGGMFGAKGVDYRTSAGASLSNSFVFAWGFFEVMAWFWVYTSLREERSEKVKIAAEKQAREDKQLRLRVNQAIGHIHGNPSDIMEEAECITYNNAIEELRAKEYPMLQDTTYLDHAGTTLYSKSLIERFSADMMANLYGNPHSASNASQLTTRRIEDVRLRLLQMFNADPEEFDVVFVSNATAGIKLVMDAFRDQGEGFWYGYHRDAHTSLIGVREAASKHRCFSSDAEVTEWIDGEEGDVGSPQLFAYPAQSNMNGRRLPLDWSYRIRNNKQNAVYTLLDAAALVSTSPLDFGNPDEAPDFTVLSLYKIFGFPDLGALFVRQASASVFDKRRYFGGGTVEMVVCLKEQWHAKKADSLHERLEDGTLPIHSIMALDSAIAVHQELYTSLDRISKHTTFLAQKLHASLLSLRHGNGDEVCHVYKDPASTYGDSLTQGPVVAFNLRNQFGGWLRTGGLCNPGGVASSLGLAPWEMRENFSAGQRCGNDNDIIRAKPTGMIRVSFGAMSALSDVECFISFLREFFVQKSPQREASLMSVVDVEPPTQSRLHVESLSVYPIKSCAGFSVPPGRAWEVRPEGLAWDREWCLVHQGTGAALNQKRYPKMALIRPSIDLEKGLLRVTLAGVLHDAATTHEITVPLSADPRLFTEESMYKDASAKVCGDSIKAQTYRSSTVSSFFTQALGVPCHLARFPAVSNGNGVSRHAKAHLQKYQRAGAMRVPGAFPETVPVTPGACVSKPILLANESPILTISRSSLNRLNELIKAEGGKAAQAEVFRANIVVAENPAYPPGLEDPYAEDDWRYLQIGHQYFEMLGACRRCQMVCIDQQTAERNQEPFVTLSKTRRFDGRVYFGEHTCHLSWDDVSSPLRQNPTITVGDTVIPIREDEIHQDSHLQSLHSPPFEQQYRQASQSLVQDQITVYLNAMAATDSKPRLATLKTPMSATYPSELRSPMVTSATTPIFANIKREDSDLKTPITPPTAYLEFLKNLSPVLSSPMSTGTSSKFVFGDSRPTSVTSSASSASFTSTSAPAEKDSPATSRSSSCSGCDTSKEEAKDPKEPPMSAPPTKLQTVTIPPPSPFTRPHSARTPRLYIPQSPYSPAAVRSPASAKSIQSPFSAVSSPKTWDADKKNGRSRRVSVREVVTRTVTYSRTPVDAKAPQFPQIDPAPRGKRRKVE